MGGPTTATSVVPAYPYNVSMLPASSNGPTPDDSGINTHLPSICVDYLSHDWAEDDVWASWKAMTRHKSEIANGVRLENASWRTWAKQRGKLKTISPETLNWLKDSDVTWLYGPLHTAVEAVPPPKVATASERLGLEPLRSLSDHKVATKATPSVALASPSGETVHPTAHTTGKRTRARPPITTKPILKYRSLSDILLPGNSPASPILESPPSLDEQTHTPIPHAKSESSLWRHNSVGRRRGGPNGPLFRGSPVASPRGTSPESAAHQSDSSSNGREKRHISFNHRVEQCIAVDSVDEAKKFPSTATSASDDEDGDDEDEVLTFRSSPRVANFGPQTMSAAHSRVPSGGDREPHTIHRLGPTTLKSTELYPAPSPIVVYSNPVVGSPEHEGPTVYPVATYSSRPSSNSASSSSTRQPMFDYSNSGQPSGSHANHSTWDPDDDDDYAMGFDYFNGPDVTVGDEYDTAQYGSHHLVGTSHNNYQGGAPPTMHSSVTYIYPGSNSSPSPTYSSSNTSSSDSSPAHSRKSSNNPSLSTSPASPSNSSLVPRGPHQPPSSAKDAASPKRSILKGAGGSGSAPRSRENSATQDDSAPLLAAVSGKLGVGSPTFSSPPSDRSPPVSSSPQMVGRPITRRTFSEEGREGGRGRSASRGSSSSLERSASSDRRSSISPQASYASIVSAGAAQRSSGLQRRGGSSDSLSSMGNAASNLSARLMPDLPEASSESETETIKATMDDSENEDEPDTPQMDVDSALPPMSPPAKDGGEIEFMEDAAPPDMEGAQLISGSPNSSRAASSKPSQPLPGPASAVLASSVVPAQGSPLKAPPLVPTPSFSPSPPESPTPPPSTSFSASASAAPSAAAGVPLSSPPSGISKGAPASPSHPATSPSASGPRYRQPSPSTATTKVADDVPPIAESRSLSNSPALDPTDLASTQWSDETVPPTTSYARRSLLRAARGGSHSSASDRDEGSASGPASRTSGESARAPGSADDFGFGYYDEDAEAGIVGTARDLLGAITKGIWGMGRRST